MKTAGADALLRYRVLRPLGPTRFGHAQLALLEGEGRSRGFFALELLRQDWAKDAELRSSFLDEAAHTLNFEHPNVVRTQEVLAASEVCGRVTRWFAGQSLAGVLERVGRAQFPLHLHVRVLCEVLAAVQYLHELEQAAGGRLVYRDTAPAHVLVTYTGQIKIVGAGFERTIEEIERRSGALFSDIDYASPELCLGYPAAPSADVYSVGVMLWEALARARRVFADTPEAKVRMRINGEEPDVDQFRRAVPERLAQICRRALAVSPRDRYPSAQELQIDLESYLADTETDAQQNAGLGALAELMGQHFAAERAEMLGYIEQQLAEPEQAAQPLAAEPPSSAPGSSRGARRSSAASEGAASSSSQPSSSAVARARLSVPPTAPRLELAEDDLDGEPAEGPTELLPTLEPARWDDHTHTVTSFEELGPVEPPAQSLPPSSLPPSSLSFSLEPASSLESAGHAADGDVASDAELLGGVARDELVPAEPVPDLPPDEQVLQPGVSAQAGSEPQPAPSGRVAPPQLLQLPVREPDTSGHRAYSSTLRPPPPPPRDWVRTAAPVALAAALVLLLGYGIRVARGTAAPQQHVASAEAPPASADAVSNAELRLQAAAPEFVQSVHPSALAEVGASAPSVAHDVVSAALEGAPNGDIVNGDIVNGDIVNGDIVELVEQGTPAPAAAVDVAPSGAAQGAPSGTGEPALVEPAVAAVFEVGSDPVREGGPEEPPSAAVGAPASGDQELEPPRVIVEELLNGEEPRPAPRARRSRKAADSRGARSGTPPPRAIDETDPYLE